MGKDCKICFQEIIGMSFNNKCLECKASGNRQNPIVKDLIALRTKLKEFNEDKYLKKYTKELNSLIFRVAEEHNLVFELVTRKF